MTALTQGFTNPVLDCQSCYRAVLDAMSRPALPVRLPVLPPLPVPGGAFGSGMAALALTLCDGETPLWLQPELRSEALHAYLRFHCGSPITADPGLAAFAFIISPLTMPPLSAFAQGSAVCPEQSAPLILSARLSGPADVLAAGPGIGGPETRRDPPRLWSSGRTTAKPTLWGSTCCCWTITFPTTGPSWRVCPAQPA